MKLKIVRNTFTDKSTIGDLLIDDKFFCYTLEDVDRKLESGGVKIYGQTCIPRGLYDLVIDFSPKYNKEMPHILNVHQFEGVRIHPGNTPADTEGCILVGSTKHTNFVGSSKATFDKLMDLLEQAYSRQEPIYLEVT